MTPRWPTALALVVSVALAACGGGGSDESSEAPASGVRSSGGSDVYRLDPSSGRCDARTLLTRIAPERGRMVSAMGCRPEAGP